MAYKFSIIIPIYNVEKYLIQCIESAISQTYKNIEIILVDDGSPDLSPSICDKYALNDTRIKVIHKKNGGLVSARQAGVKEATGDYIINLDGDDWISLNYCQNMAKIIAKYHPDIVLCGHYKEFPDTDRIKCPLPYKYGYYTRADLEEYVYPILLQDSFGHSFSLTLWGKATIASIQRQQQLNVDPAITIGEDCACMAPCLLEAQSIFIMEECMYHYRQNPKSMTKNRSVYNWEGPELRGQHLEQKLDISKFNLQQQIYRLITHALFTVVKSQFNDTEKSNSEIKKEIRKKLESNYYKTAVKCCRFRGFKANLMKYSLQYKALWIIQLFNSK